MKNSIRSPRKFPVAAFSFFSLLTVASSWAVDNKIKIKPEDLKPGNKFTVQVDADPGNGPRIRRDCLVWLPENFDPKIAHPVIVQTGYSANDVNVGESAFIREMVGKQNFIVINPVHMDGHAERTAYTGLLAVKELSKVINIDDSRLVLTTCSYGNHSVDKPRAPDIGKYALRIHWGATGEGAEAGTLRGTSSLFFMARDAKDGQTSLLESQNKSLARLVKSGADIQQIILEGSDNRQNVAHRKDASDWLYNHWPVVIEARKTVAKADKEKDPARRMMLLKNFKDAWFKQEDVDKAKQMYADAVADKQKADEGKKRLREEKENKVK